jgi:hypothetical protein
MWLPGHAGGLGDVGSLRQKSSFAIRQRFSVPDAAASRAMEDSLLDVTQRLVRNVEYASQIIAFAFAFVSVDSRVVARGMNQMCNTFWFRLQSGRFEQTMQAVLEPT